ncbi:hypothetical protein PanWU01x14_283150 [Parasponia andersonii]|uniref:Uncharacterized protein n=1 Tax=Parasponia andersonii TaxID=3476 RepID=A0A2P5B0D4_PARAD|nr:hypothetical protein PanWU01x14_283150 [Parasponia andersonii]
MDAPMIDVPMDQEIGQVELYGAAAVAAFRTIFAVIQLQNNARALSQVSGHSSISMSWDEFYRQITTYFGEIEHRNLIQNSLRDTSQ